MAVHGIDAPAQLRQDRRLIARPGADLQHGIAGLGGQSLGHQPDNRGLRDGLAAGDGQRHVLIGALGEQALHEGAPVDLLHRLQDARIGHAMTAQREQEAHLALGVP